MPTALRVGPYRFYFYSHEPNEPPHVHVDRDKLSAKFWLIPVALAQNFGFSANELGRVESIVTAHRDEILEAWNGHFGIESR
ncbi:MAG: DUF4160 domain-containing protein [Candidatus Acidiferrum sp.]